MTARAAGLRLSAMKRLALLCALLASPAAASDVCDDLWFTRNLIMDRAGYCFGSVLGRAARTCRKGSINRTTGMMTESARATMRRTAACLRPTRNTISWVR